MIFLIRVNTTLEAQVDQQLLSKIYDVLVHEDIAHRRQRDAFLEIFPVEREFKFIPPKILGVGGKLIDCALGIRVTTEKPSQQLTLFIHGVNKKIKQIEQTPLA